MKKKSLALSHPLDRTNFKRLCAHGAATQRQPNATASDRRWRVCLIAFRQFFQQFEVLLVNLDITAK